MPTKPRSEIFDPLQQVLAHVMNQCVRKLLLFGKDKATRKANKKRRRKFEKEIKKAASAFAIDLLSYALMGNHFHFILRTRPDILQQWTEEQVVEHWHKVCPVVTDNDGNLIDKPTSADIEAFLAKTDQAPVWRARLSDISWFMKLVSERIARWCNQQDGVPGHFWKGRYKSVLLLDERALLTCSAYVDLNRVEAELAASLEDSDYTSVQRRIQASVIRTSMQGIMAETFAQPTSIATTAVIDPAESDIPDAKAAVAEQVLPDAHLSPVEIDEKNDPLGPHPSQNPARCSDKGFLPMTEARYIELLKWSADQIRHRHQGQAFDDSPPELDQMNIEPEIWCKLITQFTDLFYSVAGMPANIDAHPSLAGNRFNMPQQTREMLSA